MVIYVALCIYIMQLYVLNKAYLFSKIFILDLKFTMDSDQEDTPKLSMEHLPSTHTESVSSSSGIRTTFNPFKPQQMARAVTLFKHRWLHTFPEHFKNVKPQVKRSSSEDFSSPSIKVKRYNHVSPDRRTRILGKKYCYQVLPMN